MNGCSYSGTAYPCSAQTLKPFSRSESCSSWLGCGPVIPRRRRDSVVSSKGRSSSILEVSNSYVRYSALSHPVAKRLSQSAAIASTSGIPTFIFAAVFPIPCQEVHHPSMSNDNDFILGPCLQPQPCIACSGRDCVSSRVVSAGLFRTC